MFGHAAHLGVPILQHCQGLVLVKMHSCSVCALVPHYADGRGDGGGGQPVTL